MGFLLGGTMLVGLALLNPYLLAWRKARGRDIEEEERYETDHGMIRLTPVDETERDQ
jgi:hypothetical protein